MKVAQLFLIAGNTFKAIETQSWVLFLKGTLYFYLSPSETQFLVLAALSNLALSLSTPPAALLCIAPALIQAGSGFDNWGIDTLTNYPDGRARLTVPVQANDDRERDPIEVPCQCSDADPRAESSQAVETTCFNHRVFNNCDLDFMFDAGAELAPEGFCQISCSRCNCCQSPAEVIQSNGGSRFLQAASASNPSLTELLNHPGFVGTILVPTDAAFDAAISQLGPLAQNPGLLQQILKFHILPPEPKRNALWTSPFMSLGPKMRTSYDGVKVLTAEKFDMPSGTTWRGGLNGFSINGPHNSANVITSDIVACKSYITMIDTVLLPFDPSASLPANDFLAAARILGVDGCAVQQNSLIQGSEVTSGSGNIQESIGECCDSCKETSNCNAWTYCALKGGCPAADGSMTYPFGYCQLKNSPEISAGNEPNYDELSALNVLMASGW